MTQNKIILVANSTYVVDINNKIDPSDIIVRFNLPTLETLSVTGNKTNYLFLANTHDLADKKLKKNSRFMNFFKNNLSESKIILPYSDSLIQEIKPFYQKKFFLLFKTHQQNWNNELFTSFLKFNNIDFKILEEKYYWDAHQTIQASANEIISTGLIAYFYFSTHPKFKDYDIFFNGFSFEGWDGHNWDAEKNYINHIKNNDRLTFICK